MIGYIDIENSHTQEVLTLDLKVIEYLENERIIFDISKLSTSELESLKLAISTSKEFEYTDIEMFFIGDSSIPEFGPDYKFEIDNDKLIGTYIK